MLFFAGDEHDEDRDENDEDADFDENNSDDEGEDDEQGDESDDDSDAGDDSDEDEDDDNKPVTRKEFRELMIALKGKQNRNNANRRVIDKKGGKQPTKLPADTDRRLQTVEKQVKENAILESKRQFGYEHGLSPKQVNYVFRLTQRPTAKFLNVPHVKAALETIKSQENLTRNTPSSSGKRGSGGGDGKKWSDLKPEERQSGFAARRQEILQKKQR